MHYRALAQRALDAALAADFMSLGESKKADLTDITELADHLETQFLPALSETYHREEVDVCITWLGMRRVAQDFIPDVTKMIETLRGQDWVAIRDGSVALSRAALSHYSTRDHRRGLVA